MRLLKIFLGGLVAAACILASYGVYTHYFSLSAKLDRYVQSYVDLELFSGAVLVAKEGKIVLCKAYGLANRELDVPNKIDTKFRIASMTKQFTAMAIMQLQEMGLLSVQDKLSKYISDYPRGNEITIHNLLTHTSGIPHVAAFWDEYYQERIKPHTLEQRIAFIRNKPLISNPGEKFDYGDNNYVLLTYIIEKVSGKKYEEFLKEHIFDLIDMKGSGYDDYKLITKNRAAGYARVGNSFVNADYMDRSWESGAGSLYTTVSDLYKWDRALYTDKLVSKTTLDSIFTPFKSNYGYGWSIKQSSHGKLIEHSGANPGARAIIYRLVDRDSCIIVLSNFDESPVALIADNLERVLFGEKPEHAPKKRMTIDLDPRVYDQYIGTYKCKEKDLTIVTTKERDILAVELIGKGKVEIYPETETNFFATEVDAQVSFIKDASGNVIKLIVHQGGHDISAERVK